MLAASEARHSGQKAFEKYKKGCEKNICIHRIKCGK
jgi:hypothetical protein